MNPPTLAELLIEPVGIEMQEFINKFNFTILLIEPVGIEILMLQDHMQPPQTFN